MHELKQKYRNQIQIHVGLELDFSPEHVHWTKYLLKEYKGFLEETILSVHFLKGVDGWRCVDSSPHDFEEGLIPHYQDFHAVQIAYYQTVKEAIQIFQPSRLGHLTLCQKFQHYFKDGTLITEEIKNEVHLILDMLKQKGIALDLDTAGLYKEHCLEPYPSSWIVKKAQKLGIPLVFGSDAHAVKEVGRSYGHYECMNQT